MKKENIKRGLFYGACVLPFAVCLAMIAWFASILVLRTHYKNDRLALASSFTRAYQDGARIGQGEEAFPVGEDTLDYYLDFLLHKDTTVIRASGEQPNARTVYLYLPDTTVAFTPAQNGMDTCVQWTRDGRTCCYMVNGVYIFPHLEGYLVNIRNRALAAQSA